MDYAHLCPHCMKEFSGDDPVNCPHCGKPVKATKHAAYHLPLFSILNGKYLVGDVLGEGGFGITYIGLELNLKLRVAIKEFYPDGYAIRDSSSSLSVTITNGRYRDIIEKWRDNFLLEAQSMARCIDIPEVVEVKEYFLENSTAYIVEEYLEGHTLKEVVKSRGSIPYQELREIITPVIQGIERIHQKGLIHRDISPDNIMLTNDGKKKLLDFGAARDSDANMEKTVLLKPGFGPVEQYITSGKQGSWTDVYALGATIYYCLTGKTPLESVERQMGAEIKWFSELGYAIPPSAEEAIKKAMAVAPEDRFQTAGAFLKAFSAENSEVGMVQATNAAPSPVLPTENTNQLVKHSANKKKGIGKWIGLAAGVFAVLVIVVVLVTINSKGKTTSKVTAADKSVEENDSATLNSPITSGDLNMEENAASIVLQTDNVVDPISTEPTQDLIGMWVQEDADPNNRMVCEITADGKIAVFFRLPDDNVPWTYWLGTYEAPLEETNHYTWVSQKTYVGNGLLSAQVDTKEFTYDSGRISYYVTMQGQTNQLFLVRGDWDNSVIPSNFYETDGAVSLSQQTENTMDVEDIEIKDFGWFVSSGGFLKYYLTLYNPNEESVIEYPSFRLTARDANGSVINTTDQALNIIYPKQEIVYAGQAFDVSETPNKVDIEMIPPNSIFIKNVDAVEDYIPIEVVDVSYRDASIVGEIMNPNDRDFLSVYILLLYKDESGSVTGFDYGYANNVAANGKTPFSIFAAREKEPAIVEYYAYPW